MPTLLDGLKQYTTIVADTGDVAAIARLRPRDATTNPSLILKAARKPEYLPLVRSALAGANAHADHSALDRVLVAFGVEILKHIDGRVSTEVDARLSFDTRATIERARRLIALYEAQGVDPARILIKMASTWEGMRAAETLQREGIGCNMTLLFCTVQAEAAAAAGATLISPFVGRIYDWHRKSAGDAWDEAAHAGARDPGVRSVVAIFERLRSAGFATQIMGASFRNCGQILALAGCDLLTISPELLDELAATEGAVARALVAPRLHRTFVPPVQTQFRRRLNDDAMATEQLAAGIRLFTADTLKLEELIRSMPTQRTGGTSHDSRC
jgi:transaldolase